METGARPYARAAFRIAQEARQLDEWSQFLVFLTACLTQRSLASYLMNPTIEREKKMRQLREIAALLEHPTIEERQANFLQLLLINDRIVFVAAIYRLYEEMKREQAGEAVAYIQTAFPLRDAERQMLKDSLGREGGKKILLDIAHVPELIGGLIVELEGKSMDYSIKAKLEKLSRRF